MFCKHCGAEVSDQAVICVKCGCQLQPLASPTITIETNGTATTSTTIVPEGVSEKNGVTAVLLCFFLGGLGIHNFYLGRTGIGIAQLFTLGGCGVWALIDFIVLLTGSYKDSEGKIVKL